MARLYGGSVVMLGLPDDPESELDLDSVGEGDLQYIHVLSRYEVVCSEIERDVKSPLWGFPKWVDIPTEIGVQQRVHPSRCVFFQAGDKIARVTAVNEFWSDSVLDAVDEAVKTAGIVTNGVAQLVSEAKVDIIKIPGLTKNIMTDTYRDRLTARFNFANARKSILNALILDEADTWERAQTSFSALPDILKMYLLIASGAADIPATRFLGQTAVGLNSTGESDMRNYYDHVKAVQENDMRPRMTALDECLIRSALGRRDKNIHYTWNPLWQMDEQQKAELAERKAKVFASDIATAALPEYALAKGRINQLIEDGLYPGFEEAIEEAEALGESIEDDVERRQKEEELALQQAEMMTQMGGMGGPSGAAAPGKPNGSKPPFGGGNKGGKDEEAEDSAWDADWDESEHPRDEIGRFTEAGGQGGGQGKAQGVAVRRGGRPHPGLGYSDKAFVDRDGRIVTSNTRDAIRALWENKKVVLDQPREVATLLDRLARIGRKAEALGVRAPNFNLCNVSVQGTSLFCDEAHGFPRVVMPQLKGIPLPDSPAAAMKADTRGEVDTTAQFRDYLTQQGYHITDATEGASYLRPSQNELKGANVAGIAQAIRQGKLADERIFVSKDNYIVDGHHRWAGTVTVDWEDGKGGDIPMKVARVDAGIVELLAHARAFARRMGIPQLSVAQGNPAMEAEARRRAKDDAHNWRTTYDVLNGAIRGARMSPPILRRIAALDGLLGPLETGITAYRRIDRDIVLMPGMRLADAGYVAAKATPPGTQRQGRLVELYIPAGAPVLFDQDEVLLARNSVFEVVSVNDSVLVMELVQAADYNANPDWIKGEGGRFEGSRPGEGAGKGESFARGGVERVPPAEVDLSRRDREVERSAVKRYNTQKLELVGKYHAAYGKIISADDAKDLFKDDGYNGTNAAAVHEPAAQLAKVAFRAALRNNREAYAVLYAGGSGSGKTSAISGTLPNLEQRAAAVLDGNLSKLSSAYERLDEIERAGKKAHVVYIYRDPEDAWENGVIKRMQRTSRTVPLSVFLKNHAGSLDVVRKLIGERNTTVTLINNSLGKDKARLEQPEWLATLGYDAKLKDRLLARTKALYQEGRISREQYDALTA